MIVADVVSDGLNAGEKVAYVTGFDAQVVQGFLADRRVAWERPATTGQIEIIALADIEPSADGSRAAGLAARVQAFVETGLTEGYAALRLAAEVCEVAPPGESVEQMRARERRAAQLTTSLPVTGVCLYDRKRCSEEYLMAVEREHESCAHPEGLHSDRLLTITRERGLTRLRLVGEVDLSNAVALRKVLAGAIADGDVTLDLAELSFIDVAGLRAIVQVAMSNIDRSICLCDPSPQVLALLGRCGWSHLLNLKVISSGLREQF